MSSHVVLPSDFRLTFDPSVRRPRREVLIGGSPIRVMRLTAAGAGLVDKWQAGAPVGPSAGAQALARRLLDAGLAHPRPGVSGRPSPASVAIVIPVRDDAVGLAATLESLGPAVPIVVVDDASVPPLAIGRSVRVVRRAVCSGPGPARNAGRSSLGPGDSAPEVIVFVDAGCVLDPGWLPVLLAHFADPRAGAVAPRVRNRAPLSEVPSWAVYDDAHSPLDMGPRESPVRPFSPVPYVPTAVLAVRRSAFDSVGWFDGSLRFGEDVDLVWRLAAAGWSVRYEPGTGASHQGRPTFSHWLRQRFDYGRSAAPLAARHGRAVAPVTVSPSSATTWGLASTGHFFAAAGVAGLSALRLARRAGSDRETRDELIRLTLLSHLKAADPLALGIRRAWLPPAGLAAFAVWRASGRRTRRWLTLAAVASTIGGPLQEWRRVQPLVDATTWVGLSLADDLAYQAGVWAGAVTSRSASALLPKW